ncbi:MAG: glycosyltransferase [Gemmatimonadaceae bacterium]|nr:glycosyltransferase [Gemmatimonadaceae bacterium]
MSSGGFPIQMAGIAALFDEVELVVVRGETKAGGIPLPSYASVTALRPPRGHDFRRKLSVAARLPYYVRTLAAHFRRADVVHVPLPGDIPLIGLVLALLMRKRVIARYGGSWDTNTQTTVMNRLTRALMRRVAGGRNVMLATGDGTEPPAPRMAWIFSTALTRAELDRTPACVDRGVSMPPRLVFIGRLSPEKGVATLLRSLARLAGAGVAPLPHVTIIGDGAERGALAALARELGCEHAVIFAGQLAREPLSAALARADLCVQPSLTEGFSKAWLDAMAHGLPVIASEVGAARAVIGGDGERGWLVPPGDEAALAATLEHVLTAAIDWPALRRRCRAYAERRTLEAWTQRIGEQCARQWAWTLVNGRMEACER